MKLIKLNKNIFCVSVLVVLLLIIGFVLCTKVNEAFTQPLTWEKCATEGEVCKGNGMVKYCEIADPTRCSDPKRIFDSIDCNNSVFGDVRFGQKKECLIKRAPANLNKKKSNKKHLVNYAKPDPNIQPTPPKDYCLGDLKNLDNKPMGYFQSNPDANYLVKPMDKSSITVDSIDECEANCNFDDGCVGIKFDINKAYEEQKEGGDLGPNCTRYIMAKAGDAGAISATSICTHLPGGDIINNGVPSNFTCSQPFQINPKDFTRLQEYGQASHTTEGACANECSIRLNANPLPCDAYYFDQNNRGGNNCKIFTKQSSIAPKNQSFAFPKSMFCSSSISYLDGLLNKNIYIFNVKYNKPLGAVYYFQNNNKYKSGRLVLWGNPDEVRWKITKSGNDYILTSKRYNRPLGSINSINSKDPKGKCKLVLCEQDQGLCTNDEIKWKIKHAHKMAENIFTIEEFLGKDKLCVIGNDKTNCRGGIENMGGCHVDLKSNYPSTSLWRITDNEGDGKNLAADIGNVHPGDPGYPRICEQPITSGPQSVPWHLAPAGSLTCDYGTPANQSECEEVVTKLDALYGKKPGRPMQVGGWSYVPTGCSSQTGGDWAAHFSTGSLNQSIGSGCLNLDCYSLVCSGSASDPGYDVYKKNNCNGKEYWYFTKYNVTKQGNISETECSTKCASNENCDSYLINPQNNDCFFYKFNANNVATSKCNSWPQGKFYGRIKKTNPAPPAPDPGSDVYEKNNCNGNEYWQFSNYNYTNKGNVSESECSTQCASNENCDAYLIDPDNNDCLNFKFNPNNVSTSKCSSWPEGRFYGRIKKNK
tara:strand:- start:186 stop:2633 length:2448 start_codon:yes stop_codon:yes gene_type:complete